MGELKGDLENIKEIIELNFDITSIQVDEIILRNVEFSSENKISIPAVPTSEGFLILNFPEFNKRRE